MVSSIITMSNKGDIQNQSRGIFVLFVGLLFIRKTVMIYLLKYDHEIGRIHVIGSFFNPIGCRFLISYVRMA